MVGTKEVISLPQMADTAEEFLPEKAGVTVDRVVGLCHLGVWQG